MDYQPPAIYEVSDSGIRGKIVSKSADDVMTQVLKKYILHNVNTIDIAQVYYQHSRDGVTMHSEFLVSRRDGGLLGRIDYKDERMMVPSMAILIRNGRTFAVVYRTEKVDRYSKKRDWRNPKNVAVIFEDSAGVLEQEVQATYGRYQDSQNNDRIRFDRKRDEENKASFIAAVAPQKMTGKRHFLRQKKA